MHIVDEPRKFSPSNVLTYTVVECTYKLGKKINFSLYESMANFRRAGHICMYLKIILNEAHIILRI